MINDVDKPESTTVPIPNTPSGTVSKSVTKKQTTTTTGEQEKPTEDNLPLVPEPSAENHIESEVVIMSILLILYFVYSLLFIYNSKSYSMIDRA